MADLAKLVVRLELQSAQLLNELTRTNAKLQGFERRIKGFGASVKGALAVFSGAVVFRKIIDASAEAAKNFAQLENAVLNAGAAAGGRTARDFAAVSEQLQKVTTFSDDSIQSVQQLLLRFQSIRSDRFDEATKAVLDLSTALGTDAESAAKLLGRALSDPEKGMTALSRAGVIFSEKQKKVIKDLTETGRLAEAQGLILDELAGKFGGAAEAARNNFSGALAGLKNAFDDLLEVDGGLPEATKQLNELADLLQDPATKKAADTLFSGIIVGATKAATAVGHFAEGLHLAFGGEGSNEMVEIDKQIRELIDRQSELNAAINNKATNGFLGLSVTAEQAKKEIVGVNDQIKELQKLYDELAANGGKRKPAAAGGAGGAEILPDITVTDGLSEAAEKARKAIEAEGKALTESLLTPLERYEAAVARADKLLAANVITQETWVAALAGARAELDGVAADILEVSERYKDLEQQVEEGIQVEIDAQVDRDLEGTIAGMPDIGKQIEEDEKKLDQFAHRAAENMQDIIGGGLRTALHEGVENGVKGALDAFIDMLEQMAIEAIAADIAGKIFGTGEGEIFGSEGGGWLQKGLDWLKGLGGGTGGTSTASTGADAGGWITAIASIFGSMDMGGRGEAGVPVAIGRGVQPELFVPDSAGEFYPKGTWGGGGKTEINFHIAAPTGRVSLETQQQIATRTQQALAQAQRRNG